MKKVLLSAVQPSNRMTIGNYLGAVRNWVKLQHDYESYFITVDLHAITVKQDPKELREQTYYAIATYLASGLDEKKAAILVQSHVPEHAELAWVLNCFTYMGELSRMTQYKDKVAKQQKEQGENVSIAAGLFNYPVLMASDILLYRTNIVPIGEDQKQHLELTRDIAVRMNNLFGKDLFVIPEVYMGPVGARIMSLQNPLAKMSKSDPDPAGAVYLTDSDDQIVKKIKRAVTDSGAEVIYEDGKPGIKNLLDIQAAFSGKPIADIVESYRGKQYGHLKIDTAEIVAHGMGPIRDRAAQLMKDKTYLDSILKNGAEKARGRAGKTLTEVYERVGFVHGRY